MRKKNRNLFFVSNDDGSYLAWRREYIRIYDDTDRC